MLKNHLRSALRSLLKRKGISSLNILGLSIGIAVSLVMGLYVLDEFSFDSHHVNAENIYRVVTTSDPDGANGNAFTSPPIGPALVRDYPEVISQSRIYDIGERAVTIDGETQNKEVFGVDATFFEIFNVEVFYGDVTNVFENRQAIIITDETAMALYGKIDVVGKMLKVSNRDFSVAAIIKKDLKNTQFQFDMLLFFENLVNKSGLEVWGRNFHQTYVQVEKGTDLASLQGKVLNIRDNYEENESNLLAYLQPLTDIHLNPNIEGNFGLIGNKQYVRIASIAAILILLMVSINFMNISLASGLERLKEVGVRKVLGSTRKLLMQRFIVEVVLSVVLASAIAILIADIALSPFNQLIDKQLTLPDYLLYFSPTSFILIIVGFLASIVLISGVYPAIYFAKLNSLNSLKGQVSTGLSKSVLRRSLIVLQYVMSISLVTFALVISAQINFIQKQGIGWDKENLIHFPIASTLSDKYEVLKGEFLQDPNILDVTAVSELPLTVQTAGTFTFEGMNQEKVYTITYMNADADFFETFRLQSSLEFAVPEIISQEVSNYVINESALKMMREEWGPDESPIGKKIDKGIIVGVVKDFNHQSIHQGVSPIMYGIGASDSYGRYSTIVARVAPGKIREGLEHLQSTIRKFDPSYNYEIEFLDKSLMALYKSETVTGKIVNGFSVLAIIISCIGIFGLVALDAEKRKKELGIRKVLGADGFSIMLVIGKKFLFNLLIGGLIALPLSLYISNGWLDSFAYRVDGLYRFFLVTLVVTVVVSSITILLKMLQHIHQNPIVSLREE
jgi:putative ABC transport system permease protein